MQADHDDSSPAYPEDFRAAVVAALAAVGYSVARWEGVGANIRSLINRQQRYLGLSNLYRRAQMTDRGQWANLIGGFVRRLARINAASIPANLATVADRLRPRLGQPFDRTTPHPWSLPLPGTGLEITLVIDFPHAMAYVTDDMLKKSRMNGEDLLDIALQNLRTITPDNYFERVSDECDLYIGQAGDGYDAARALLADELIPGCEAGLWIAIPNREEIAVWPVTLAALGRVHVLKMFAEENFQNRPYPITDEVFWVWNGTWYRFGIQLQGNELVMDVPNPFGEVLNDLHRRANNSE